MLNHFVECNVNYEGIKRYSAPFSNINILLTLFHFRHKGSVAYSFRHEKYGTINDHVCKIMTRANYIGQNFRSPNNHSTIRVDGAA